MNTELINYYLHIGTKFENHDFGKEYAREITFIVWQDWRRGHKEAILNFMTSGFYH
jgi:hypothetical protein